MMRWRNAIVRSVRAEWPGSIEYVVQVFEPREDGAIQPVECRALAYTDAVGRAEIGDEVLLNVTALHRGLGTGGMALVVAVPQRLPADPPDTPGHLVKARYTPLQQLVLGVDEQESDRHDLFVDADTIDTLPVVVADLHSALPAVVAGIHLVDPALRVAYVMTDGGALPAAFSRTVAGLRAAGAITGCVTVGQCYGGDLEAVTVHTGLIAARQVLHADVAVVAQGPGNLGTGTRWGFSGVAAGEAVNAVNALGGQAVASLRVSQADARERHRGISHHSLTAYGRVALTPADLPVPTPASALDDQVLHQARTLCEQHPHLRLVQVPRDGITEALAASPVPLSTMGRGLEEDPAAFTAAAVAGVHAARLARS